MKFLTRHTPTTEGAAAIRAALALQGIKGRVAKQRFAYRVVSTDDRAEAALIALGLGGPAGGKPAHQTGQFFAYDLGGLV